MKRIFLVAFLAVCATSLSAQQPPSDTRPTLWLIGDSTVNVGTAGQRGWGSELPAFYDGAKVRIMNRARGGRSSRTFLTEGLWAAVETELKPGDAVLMQFGHNDGGEKFKGDRPRASLKGSGEESETGVVEATGNTETIHTYGWYLKQYVQGAKSKGATPVVLSPVPRNIWKDGKVARANKDYGLWASEVAKSEKALFFDLNEQVARRYEQDGQEKVATYFGSTDHTHTLTEGAKVTASIVADGLKALAGFPESLHPTVKPPVPEALDRGVIAVRAENGAAFVSWRLLQSDPKDAAFEVLRDGKPVATITGPTCYTDSSAPKGARYSVRIKGQQASAAETLSETPYLNIPLDTPTGYAPNDASIGDLDGDGKLDIVLHQAGRGHDNSQSGPTDPPILQAYTLSGKKLWAINLGPNIREGAHYTQFLVYDFDGDGRAEIACKTADGTRDGIGKVIGDATKRYANTEGRVLDGPEYLTVFDGRTGAALSTVDYVPARGKVADWGDAYGNRVDRFIACVAYLDGVHPSLVFCRGYYTRTVLAAWDFQGGKLVSRWVFDSQKQTEPKKWEGQGNHNVSVADVDGDGRDEIIYGAMTIDDDGHGLYSTGLGHGDALHVTDIDPTRPGLEVFAIHEHVKHQHGTDLRDARTGEILWSKPSPDVGRGIAIDIDPRYPGSECWASGQGLSGLWSAKGEQISPNKPRAANFGIWWDGDVLREVLDGKRITKWNWESATETTLLDPADVASNNGTKANPCLSGDILGDWREELMVRTADNKALHIYTTTIPTEKRFVTFLQDRQYRLALAWQNVGYNQPPHPSFALK
ncbi:MAG: GDSL-type esterase/lipase family protein [Armatimonas sp.]